MAINEGYIGLGKLWGRLAGTTGALREFGNASLLTLKVDLDEKRQQDFTSPGGGTLKKVSRVKSVNADITLLSFNPANFALAAAGDTTAVTSATVTAEVVKGYKGALVPTAKPPRTITTVTNAAGTTTYVAGTDYTRAGAGLLIPSTSTITDGADLKVTYVTEAYDQIEAATKTASIMELFFDGLNEAEGNAVTVVNLYRVSMPPASELALISDNLGELKFSAELLKDTSKGAGVSGYWKAQKVQVP